MQSQVDLNKEKLSQSNYFVRNNQVLDYVDKNCPKSNKLLEIGCGRGELSKKLLGLGYDLVLLDIEKNVDDLQVDIVDVSFDKMPYPEGQFDAVLAIAVVEHLENPFLFYRESARVLKSGGLLMVAVPNVLSLKSRIKFLLSGDVTGFKVNNNHISFFSRAVFQKTVLHNFTLKDVFYSQGFIKIFNKKIRFGDNNFFGKLFGEKILYILKKK